jgi:hypothetical protein
VIRRRAPNLATRAGRKGLINVNARQSHVAISMPSRATVTIRSISSGVMT